jgi:hypothetical protein
MRRTLPTRSKLLAPLVHLAALFLLLEEWFWDLGLRLGSRIAAWPPLRRLEARVRALPPWPALVLFALPGLLLFPVKVLAVVAIAHGHAASGNATIVAAKVGGAAVVARLYVLTLPSLLALGWFARLHRRFIALRDRWTARLRASRAFRLARHLARSARRRLRRLLHRLGPAVPWGSRQAGSTSRILRRYIARWRSRRRPSSQTPPP